MFNGASRMLRHECDQQYCKCLFHSLIFFGIQSIESAIRAILLTPVITRNG
jgi:hypothetical protein